MSTISLLRNEKGRSAFTFKQIKAAMYRARKSIGKNQAHFERDLHFTPERQMVLNGRIKVGDRRDIEYKFQYSQSDDTDKYIYSFDTYPTKLSNIASEPKSPRSVKSGELADDESSDGIDDGSADDESSDEVNVGLAVSLDLNTSERVPDKIDILKTNTQVRAAHKKTSNEQGQCSGQAPGPSKRHDNSNQSGKYPTIRTSKAAITFSMAKSATFPTTRKAPREYHAKENTNTQEGTALARKASRVDTGNYSRRTSVAAPKSPCNYDPVSEKSSAFIHGGDKNFSRANTTLGSRKHIQLSYTETNLETNQGIIFLDLLKTSHRRSSIRDYQIQTIERRLAQRRENPLYSTSYYEHKNIADPHGRTRKHTARSAAQKKLERQEKIKQTSEEIHTGYVPTQYTMKVADREEVEHIGNNCRYLRSDVFLARYRH